MQPPGAAEPQPRELHFSILILIESHPPPIAVPPAACGRAPLWGARSPLAAPPGCRLRSSRTCPVDLVPVGFALCLGNI